MSSRHPRTGSTQNPKSHASSRADAENRPRKESDRGAKPQESPIVDFREHPFLDYTKASMQDRPASHMPSSSKLPSRSFTPEQEPSRGVPTAPTSSKPPPTSPEEEPAMNLSFEIPQVPKKPRHMKPGQEKRHFTHQNIEAQPGTDDIDEPGFEKHMRRKVAQDARDQARSFVIGWLDERSRTRETQNPAQDQDSMKALQGDTTDSGSVAQGEEDVIWITLEDKPPQGEEGSFRGDLPHASLNPGNQNYAGHDQIMHRRDPAAQPDNLTHTVDGQALDELRARKREHNRVKLARLAKEMLDG